MQAIILAAGMGTRLGEITKNKPKGFLSINGDSLIELSIQKLIRAGITEILIGTGYLSAQFEDLAFKYPQLRFIKNDMYANTGSMYTLANMRHEVDSDFLLLESDLLYDQIAVDVLAHHCLPNVVLASEFTGSGDEVFIETDENSMLINMSKQKSALSKIYAELVGISKISLDLYRCMCEYMDNHYSENPKLDYENVLSALSTNKRIFINKLTDFSWCEIDDENHLKRAVEKIYPKICVSENKKKYIKRNVLLNPGPATTTDTVKYAQVVTDICPRESSFGDVMQWVSESLTEFVGDPKEYAGILFGGSGTAVVEAMLSSVVDDSRLLIVNNGAYGVRMCQIATAYGLNYRSFDSAVDKAIDLKALEATITGSDEQVKFLSIIHHETTTGILNDIETIGAICKKYGITMIVDAMSSFAAIPINMKKMNISYLASSSNKNIQGMAGVGFIIANKQKLEATKDLKPRNFYLNLYAQYENFIRTKQMRFTPPVQTIFALRQAIIETQKETITNRYKRYTETWKTLLDGIAAMGLQHMVDEKDHGRIITAIFEPENMNYDFKKMHDYFYDRGFTIYPGKVGEAKTFRIANIGNIDKNDMNRFLSLLKQYLTSIGSI